MNRMHAYRVPSIFCRSTNVSTERHTMRGLRLPAWPGGGGRAAGQPPVGQPPVPFQSSLRYPPLGAFGVLSVESNAFFRIANRIHVDIRPAATART